MSNGLRHFLGLIVGILLTPVFAAGLAWGPHWTSGIGLGYDLAAVPGVAQWVPSVAVLAVLGLLLGLATGSRLSPLAALLPGLVLGAAGVVQTAGLPVQMPGVRDLLQPADGLAPWFAWGPVFAVVGAALFISALPPSRWRRRIRREADYEGPYSGYEPAGYDDYGPRGGWREQSAESGATPPGGVQTTQTMSWDADGMPPRYHVSDPTGPQSAGWNEPRRSGYAGAGEETGSTPPRWEDRNTGP
ncbi:hypothetical protein [Streptomonospora litoralis]|uniref:Uncharacterized protein n=1 Tax=Streptomonospora litoralis TaxID=2498135 RepID=A0A4P6Q1J4_9ACTN|nr:hypothetical protein [Streptomonospora litoralis]QBI52457.1 hypothetical protein EKD16_03230 [Streptomonospora litoralis]